LLVTVVKLRTAQGNLENTRSKMAGMVASLFSPPVFWARRLWRAGAKNLMVVQVTGVHR